MKHHLPDHECSKFVEKVFLVLDGEIPEEERNLFIEDIERCKYCLDLFNIEKELKEYFSSKMVRKICSEQLKKTILEQIKEIQFAE